MIEVLKQSLEHGSFPQGSGIIHELKKAIAELESQEPVAWRTPNWSNLHGEYGYRDFDDPVCGIDGKPSLKNEPLYTTPPHRTWVGLTNEEIEVLFQTAAGADEEVHIRFARAIESKMKELNDHSI